MVPYCDETEPETAQPGLNSYLKFSTYFWFLPWSPFPFFSLSSFSSYPLASSHSWSLFPWFSFSALATFQPPSLLPQPATRICTTFVFGSSWGASLRPPARCPPPEILPTIRPPPSISTSHLFLTNFWALPGSLLYFVSSFFFAVHVFLVDRLVFPPRHATSASESCILAPVVRARRTTVNNTATITVTTIAVTTLPRPARRGDMRRLKSASNRPRPFLP